MPQQDFLLLVIFYGFLIILLPIAAGIFRIRHLDPGGHTVFVFCIVSFLFEIAGTVLWLTKTSNLWLGHLYTIIEFVVLANVYRYALRGFIKPAIIPVIIVLFTLLAIINTLFLQGFKYNNSNIKIIEATVLITFALMFFYKLVRQLVVARLEKLPMFWVNCAVLIYFSSNMFIFLYSNYVLLYSKLLGIRIWFIHSLFFILFHIILAVSLWIVPRNSNSHG